MWWHRAAPAASDAVTGSLRGLPVVPLTVAALVRYVDSPVGSYSELVASPVLVRRAALPAVSVPFIAVDSWASLVGGRAGWGLPKTMARFRWPGSADGNVEAEVGLDRLEHRGEVGPLRGTVVADHVGGPRGRAAGDQRQRNDGQNEKPAHGCISLKGARAWRQR